MDFLSFLWTACWREADKVTRAIQIVAVTFPFIMTILVGVVGGEWSREAWPAWVWALITFGTILLAIFYGIATHAYRLEVAYRPQIKLRFECRDPWVRQTPARVHSINHNTHKVTYDLAVYFRVQVDNQNAHTVAKNCLPLLTDIQFRPDNRQEFKPTNYGDTLRLAWSAQPEGNWFAQMDVTSGTKRFFDLFYVIERGDGINVSWDQDLLVNQDIFTRHGEYRFDVLVTTDTGRPVAGHIVVKWDGKWDQMQGYMIDDQPQTK